MSRISKYNLSATLCFLSGSKWLWCTRQMFNKGHTETTLGPKAVRPSVVNKAIPSLEKHKHKHKSYDKTFKIYAKSKFTRIETSTWKFYIAVLYAIQTTNVAYDN